MGMCALKFPRSCVYPPAWRSHPSLGLYRCCFFCGMYCLCSLVKNLGSPGAAGACCVAPAGFSLVPFIVSGFIRPFTLLGGGRGALSILGTRCGTNPWRRFTYIKTTLASERPPVPGFPVTLISRCSIRTGRKHLYF